MRLGAIHNLQVLLTGPVSSRPRTARSLWSAEACFRCPQPAAFDSGGTPPHSNGCAPAAADAPRSTLHAPRSTPSPSAFTLIELILVMAILTISVSMTAPVLSHFFRGRALDSEARRLLALSRNAQSRAAAEGVPMDLWVDTANNLYGLEAEPSYEDQDAHGIECALDKDLKLEVLQQPGGAAPVAFSLNPQEVSQVAVRKVALVRANLPTIRFLPDGSIAETSPRKLRLTSQEGYSLWVAQARDRLSYEIRDHED